MREPVSCPGCGARCRPVGDQPWVSECPRCGRKVVAGVRRPAARAAPDAGVGGEVAAWVGMKRALLPAAAGVVLSFAAVAAGFWGATGVGREWGRAAEVTEFWLTFLRYLPAIFACAYGVYVPYPLPRALAVVSLAAGLAALGFHIAGARLEWARLPERLADGLQVAAFVVFVGAASSHLYASRRSGRVSAWLLVVVLLLVAVNTGMELLFATATARRPAAADPVVARREAADRSTEKQAQLCCLTCCNPFRLLLFVSNLELLRRFGRQLDHHLDQLRRGGRGA